MILDLDVGNSRVKWRLQNGGQPVAGVAPNAELEVGLNALSGHPVRRVRVSCVAGEALHRRIDACVRKLWGLDPEYARVVPGVCGVTPAYRQPQRLGVDRWLALLAGFQHAQSACAVIDAGSAMTADFVTAEGQHLGGLILPGVRLMRESLFSQTDAVKVDALTLPQKWSPGCDTVACVENGLAAAVAGFVHEVVRYGENHCGRGLVVLACGGDAGSVARTHPRVKVCPDLVLDGLALALPQSPPAGPSTDSTR